MNIKIYRAIFFMLLITVCQNNFSEASAEVPNKHVRKGLPLEMVISADELRELQVNKTNFVLLDARSEKSYKESHIQDALLPLTPENLKKYSRDTLIVTYCSSGGCQASAVLALQIKRMGFKDVRAMEDGIQVWAEKGYPVKLGAKTKNQSAPPSQGGQGCPDEQSSDCPDGASAASRLA